jgi:hypothetical protein
MKNQDQKFDRTFRQKSRDIKIKPSADVWQNIDQRLSRRKRFSVYSMIALAASVFLIAGFFGLFFLQNQEFENPNYHVQQVEDSGNQNFDVALMKWVDISNRS